MVVKTIKVSERSWRKLMKWRIDLGCKTLEEVIERILRIVPANKIKNG